MNEEVIKIWAEALRSGKYKPFPREQTVETVGAMHSGDMFDFCGVLCELHREKYGGEWIENAVNKHLVYLENTCLLPKEVLSWLGVRMGVNSRGLQLVVEWMSEANRRDFAAMAAVIEAWKTA